MIARTCAAISAAACLAFFGCAKTEAPKKEAAAPPKVERAPDVYKVRFQTSKGDIVVEVTRAWAPRGADRFYELVSARYYDGNRFFRVVRNFIVQFGINGNPKVSRLWSEAAFLDDPVKQSNRKGTITFAHKGPATRATQVFFNLKDNTSLDKQNFAPFGKVVSGMDVVESLYNSYGDWPPRGNGPKAERIEAEGNAYLEAQFPRLDYIVKATIE